MFTALWQAARVAHSSVCSHKAKMEGSRVRTIPRPSPCSEKMIHKWKTLGTGAPFPERGTSQQVHLKGTKKKKPAEVLGSANNKNKKTKEL